MIAIATKAGRLAEQSASIINSAIEGRNKHPTQDASVTVTEAVSSPGSMRQIEVSTRKSPSKRPRGRSRIARPGQDLSSPQFLGAQKTGRLRRPTYNLNQQGTKSTARVTGKNVFDIPEELFASKTGTRLSQRARNKQPVDENVPDTTEANRDLIIVNSMRQDSAEFENTTNGHILEPKNPVRRGRPKGTTKKISPIQTRTTDVHDAIPPLTRTLRHHAAAVKQPTELARKPEINAQEVVKAPKDTGSNLPERYGKKTKSNVPDKASLVNAEHVAEEGSVTDAKRSGANATLNLTASGSSSFISPTLISELYESDAHENRQGINGRKNVHELGDNAQPETTDRVQASGEEGEEVQQEALVTLELFGQQDKWQKVLSAARSIGIVKKGHARRRHKIPLETQTIKNFIDGVREASECYQSLAAYNSPDDYVDDIVESRLLDHLDWLGTKMEDLEESQADRNKSSIIQDIYAHAIPKLVFLINRAFLARSALYSAPGDTQRIQEIIWLLELTIDLCQKAMSWKAAPKTELPIKSQTRKVIFPSLRLICDAFETELEDRTSEKRKMREEAVRAEGYQAREVRWLEQEEKSRRERERRQRRGAEDALRISRSVGLRSLSQPSRQAVAQDNWNDEQDDELLRLLEEFQTQPGM